jgi:hypothetical protein
MTAREQHIAKRILDYLHGLDGGQAHALTIHGEIGGLSCCPTREFDEVLGLIDTKKWISGVGTEFKGVLWNITSLGESKRNQF